MPLLALAGLVLLAVLALAQVALIAGAPLGRFAWGGRHTVLPPKLRVGSAVAILIYAVFALFLLSSTGTLSLIGDPVLSVGMWVISVYLVLATLLNLISRSKSERALMTPLSLALAAVFLAATLTA